MQGYFITLGLAFVGLIIFFMNCDSNFDKSLFWRPKSGKQHVRECWRDVKIWSKSWKTKDEEVYKGWIECIHPTYLPFDLMADWICGEVVEKYEDRKVERPEWMNKKGEGKFIKRITEVYSWGGGGRGWGKY